MYFLLIFVILIMYYYLEHQPVHLREKTSTKFAYLICVILVLLAAFRGNAVGTDTEGYRLDYQSLGMYHSLNDLIDRYTQYYMGYFVPSKIFHMIGMPVQVWFGFVMAFYLYSMMRLINLFSKDKVFSLLVFVTIGLWSFSMAGLKQTFASSMMMLAFVSFIEKKYYLTVPWIILVYFTHQAALIGLAFVPLYYVRKSKLFIPFTIIACAMIYFYSFTFMQTMVDIMDNEKWEGYLTTNSAYSYVTFIFYSVITGISLLNFKSYYKFDSENSRYFLGLSILGCGMQLLAGVSPSLFRLAFLYTPFMMIVLPNCTYYCNSSYKTLVKLLFFASIIFYFLYTGRNSTYAFL